MALSLDDYEDVKAAQEAASTASAVVAAEEPASAASGAFVPSANDSKPAPGAAIPQLINQAWEGIKPYLNPVHYNAGGPENFDNLDIPTTLAHGLVEGAAGLGLANRLKRELSGEAASARQFKRQNDLVERRIARAEAIDAASEAANVKAVEQKVSAQAAGKPVPQGRVEPTFSPEPAMGGMSQEPTLAPQPAAPKPQLPQATMAGQQQSQMQYGQTTLNAPAVTSPSAPVVPSAEKVAAAQQATPDFEQKLGKPTVQTGTGLPAYQGEGGDKAKMRKEFASVKDIPKDYVFVPGGQNMDIVRNAVGQDTYTKTLKEAGGFPSTTEQAYQQSRDINKAAGRLPREQAKATGASLGETVKGITKAVGGSKTVRVAGVTGALVLATDLASAAEEGVSAAKKGDTQMARGYATDIAGALTGPFGFLASQMLGTSPEDLRILRAAEQGRKVGGGRGIAPPTSYQR